jgi:hypothetical protein
VKGKGASTSPRRGCRSLSATVQLVAGDTAACRESVFASALRNTTSLLKAR